MSWTDDPCADARRHQDEQERELSKLPVCTYCDNPIQEDTYFDINGECVCTECLNEHHRKWTSDYVN